ncbi:hypothetical protein N9437_03035 [Acidimicrobiia bacterium]|nr:hypothetical protein [Acidimicrobiia bacterium]
MFKNQEILNSYNFARQSDIVFSEIVTKKQFEMLNLKNVEIIDENERLIFYKLTKLTLKENDLIFCNTDVVKNLFKLLSKIKNLKNIKIITNQTDTLVDKALYDLKPSCVKFWYSINVGHVADDLIPIPLGLSNDYSPKNILVDDVKFTGLNNDSENYMYLNFSRNTNFSERRGLYNDYENKEWTIVDNPELKIDDYQSSVEKYRFIMCPWGNGVDTHRVWETLYSGNIPVTKEHHTFSTSLGLPVLFIHDYDDITLEKLTNFYDEKKDTENIYEKLDINYWIDNIKNFKINSEQSEKVQETLLETKKFIFLHKTKSKFYSRLKKVKYYFRKIKKIKKLIR